MSMEVLIQWNSVMTNSVVNEHSVITKRYLGQIGHFTTQMNPVITNKNGRSRGVRYNRVGPNSIQNNYFTRTVIPSFHPIKWCFWTVDNSLNFVEYLRVIFATICKTYLTNGLAYWSLIFFSLWHRQQDVQQHLPIATRGLYTSRP
jgi:hypothetical protein